VKPCNRVDTTGSAIARKQAAVTENNCSNRWQLTALLYVVNTSIPCYY